MFDPLIGGALIGGAADLISGFFSSNSSSRMQKRQLEHADAAATTAYIRQNEMMDKMNLYNSPVQQMERYRQAGLNPYLMIGEGGSTVSAATANVQQANTPSVSYAPNYYEGVGSAISTATSNYLAAKRLENETKVAEAQAAKLYADAGLSNTRNDYEKSTIDIRVESQNIANKLNKERIINLSADTLLKETEMALNRWKADNIQASTAEINAKKDYIMVQIAAQNVLNKWLPKMQAAQHAELLARAKNEVAQGRYADAMISINKFNAETQRSFYNISRDKFYYEKYIKDPEDRILRGREVDNQAKKIENDYKAATEYSEKDFGKDVMKLTEMVIGGILGVKVENEINDNKARNQIMIDDNKAYNGTYVTKRRRK